jgi:hypothetical protein
MDIAGKLAGRLERLDNHLAIVLSIHLFVEHLLGRFLEKRYLIANRVREYRFEYRFRVKLALAFHMGLIERGLFDNLAKLNELRNTYAHKIDVDLADKLDQGFLADNGQPLFADVAATRQSIRDDPSTAGVEALLRIGDATFGWLHHVATQHGVGI